VGEVAFFYYPSRINRWSIFVSGFYAVVFFVLSAWIIYRNWVKYRDDRPIPAVLISMAWAFGGVAAELISAVFIPLHWRV